MNQAPSTAPLFSVITPVFNAAPKLEATVASVLVQPAGLFEYLVIDGGSTDGTREILEQQDASVQWISEPDRGIYDAMNKGIARAQGKYLYFLGAGDCLRPGALAAMANLVPLGGTALVYGNVYWAALDRVHDGPWTAVKFTRGCPCHQAIFYSREVFTLLGQYDIQYPIGADYILNIKAFGDPRIRKIYTDTLIADYEGGGISTTENDPAFFRDAPGVIRRHLGLVPYLFCRLEMGLPASVKQGRYRAAQAARRGLKRLRRGPG